MSVHDPIRLSTGRLVLHSRMDNGAQDAHVEDGSAMTEPEWQEYCAIIHAETVARVARLVARHPFNPFSTITGYSKRCRDCGEMEAAHAKS